MALTIRPINYSRRTKCRKKISEISVVSSSLRWSELLKRLKQVAGARTINQTIPVAWFSDGQKYAVDYTVWENDSLPLSLFYLSHAKKQQYFN